MVWLCASRTGAVSSSSQTGGVYMRYKYRRPRIICVVLSCALVAAVVWASIASVQLNRANARIEELELSNLESWDVPAENQSAIDSDEAAAEFNGGIVTVGEAATEYASISTYYQMLGMNEADYAEDAKRAVLDGLVEEKVLEQKAKEFGVYELTADQLSELEAQVQAEYEANVQYYMDFRFEDGKSEEEIREDTIEYLAESGYTYESLLESAKATEWTNKLYEYVTGDLVIDDAQLKQFYDEQVTSMQMTYSASYADYESDCDAGRTIVWHPEGVRRVQGILIAFNEDQQNQYANIQAELAAGNSEPLNEVDALYQELMPRAQEVLARVQSGEDFVSLINEIDGTLPSGMHISAQSTIYGDAIRDAAMGLQKIGDVSGIVQSDVGLWILRYASDVTPGPVAFEEVSEDLRANYQTELQATQYNRTVEQWLAEANVQYHTDRF